jgi:methionyl-tRNA formyltransferase
MRLIFMGTPHFAVPALQALAEARMPGHLFAEGIDIVAVITRPDKPSGRGQGVLFSPVKEHALALGLPVWQPGPLRRPENLEELQRLAPDIIVVAAFGQILRREVLDLPRFGCINVHASLLPRHRGASPITAAILAGDTEAGVTIMKMDEGLDTGPMLAQRAIPLTSDETTGTLTEKLSHLGAALLVETLPHWCAGELAPQPQDEMQATHTTLLKKEDGVINWQLPAEVIARQVRAYKPWPGTSTTWRGKMLKIQQATALEPALETFGETDEPVGNVSHRSIGTGRAFVVRCGQGFLRLEVIQLEGKRAMSADEFIRGQPAIIGDMLGNHA